MVFVTTIITNKTPSLIKLNYNPDKGIVAQMFSKSVRIFEYCKIITATCFSSYLIIGFTSMIDDNSIFILISGNTLMIMPSTSTWNVEGALFQNRRVTIHCSEKRTHSRISRIAQNLTHLPGVFAIILLSQVEFQLIQ